MHVAGNVGDADFVDDDLGLVDDTADGTKLTHRRYDGAADPGFVRNDWPVGIAVAPTRATVYVAGRSVLDGDQFFLDTVAWGRTGAPEWSGERSGGGRR